MDPMDKDGMTKLAPVESMNVPETEVLLEHTFRVWNRGRGRDYKVVLTPTNLILTPTVAPGTAPPPICCICPCTPSCLAKCTGRTINISGRDVIACRPAANGGPYIPRGAAGNSRREKQLMKKLDPATAGHPVFMLIAYPTVRENGVREKMALHFHLLPTRNSGNSKNDNDDAVFSAEAKNSDGSRRPPPRQTSLAAKVRDTWVHAIETSLLPEISLPMLPATVHGKPIMPKLLVIVNPFSGVKKSESILKDELVPFFIDAGIDFEVLVTTYAGHAREVVAQERLTNWRGIVTVSGDGLIHEVINGIFERVDWREALKRWTFGIVPGGSGNGLSRSLVFEQEETFDGSGLYSSLLNVVRGRIKNLDLFYAESVHFQPRLAFLHLSYGILADIDIESEALRPLGEARFSIYALKRIISLRTYRAKLWYLPASDYSELEKPPEKSRKETVRKLEEALEKETGNESERSASPISTATGSAYEDDAEVGDAVEETKLPDKVETESVNKTESVLSTSSTSSKSTSASSSPRESMERDLPEETESVVVVSKVELKKPASVSPTNESEKGSENNNNENNINSKKVEESSKTGEEVTVLPSDYQFLFNRFSYTNLLTQGHLYFRSWDELQYQVLGSMPEEPSNPIMARGPPEVLQQLSRQPPFDRRVSSQSDEESSLPEHVGPEFRDMPPLSEPLPTGSSASNETASISSQDGSTRSYLDDWVYEEGEYVGISLINVPFLDATARLSPKSRTDDGVLHLMILRGDITRKNLLKLMIEMENGRHINIPGLELIPVRAARFEPLGSTSLPGGGIMTLDGEVVPTGLVQVHAMPGAAKVFIK